jgi:membrane associated rhomboid family serine protease
MFILPIRTNIRPYRTPYVNYALIIINAVFFMLSYSQHIDPRSGAVMALRPWAEPFMLIPLRPFLWQFVSYAFLHGGFMHIIGNMFFLYLFGNNVNDKLGSIGYLCFYLAGAVFSGIGHSLLSNSPVLGASGAVAAVTGAYLVLFPQTLVTVMYWLIFIGRIEVSALYFIAFKMIFMDNVIARSTPNVAYDAHLAGYAFGIIAMLVMLTVGLIEPSSYDLWYMIKQWNRRRVYRDSVSAGFDPYTGRTTRKIKVKQVEKTPAELEKLEKIKQFRNDITTRINERNLAAAADIYVQLLDFAPDQILPKQQLLDIANLLASQNKADKSAQAYEQFLKHYANYEYAEQVELMLGILYGRYLGDNKLAIKYLKSAAEKLSDPQQLKMCKDELAKLA